VTDIDHREQDNMLDTIDRLRLERDGLEQELADERAAHLEKCRQLDHWRTVADQRLAVIEKRNRRADDYGLPSKGRREGDSTIEAPYPWCDSYHRAECIDAGTCVRSPSCSS
jgi:hypothetical protein